MAKGGIEMKKIILFIFCAICGYKTFCLRDISCKWMQTRNVNTGQITTHRKFPDMGCQQSVIYYIKINGKVSKETKILLDLIEKIEGEKLK